MCHGHSTCVCHLDAHHDVHHDVHHHAPHHTSDHLEINRLQVETDKLITDRKALQRVNTQTLEEVENLKQIEGDLRNNVDDLLKEMEDKDKFASATTAELRENIHALTAILTNREEELAKEIETTTELQAQNEELTATNVELKQLEEKLSVELSAAKEILASTLAKNAIEVRDLETKLTALVEAGRCAPQPVVVYNSHPSFSHC